MQTIPTSHTSTVTNAANLSEMIIAAVNQEPQQTITKD